MSNITLAPNAAGTATFTLASPATNTNQVLTLPDTTNTLTAQGTALIRSGVLTASGVNVDFLSAIPSWAKRVTVMVNGLASGSTMSPVIRIGSGGAVVATGYASSAGAISSGTGAAQDTTGFLQIQTAATGLSFVSTLVNQTGNLWMATGIGSYGTNSTVMTFGSITLSGVLDSLRITTLTGVTLTGGTVNIMWEG